jgi:2'-5' RNA ligase
MRLFLGLPIQDSVSQHLHQLCEPLQGCRWLPEEQWHLTLCFLGELEEDWIEDLSRAFEDEEIPPIEISIHRLGTFNRHGAPRVLWAAVEENPALYKWQKNIRQRLQSLGLTCESKAFQPHITLGRLQEQPSPQALSKLLEKSNAIGPVGMELEEMVLYRSTLTPDGAQYEVVQRFPDFGVDDDWSKVDGYTRSGEFWL